MARKADTPCSICGTLLWSGTTSRPAETRVCQPCRRIRTVPHGAYLPPLLILCTVCGESFEVSRRGTARYRKTCSPGCATRARVRPCVDCGLEVTATTKASVALCRPCAKVRRAESNRRNNLRRHRLLKGAGSEPYTREEIAERDGFRCKLCGRKVNMQLKYPHLKAPTIDHVIPLSEGGDDTRVNVQLAHFQCNSRKGARGHQQLALVG